MNKKKHYKVVKTVTTMHATNNDPFRYWRISNWWERTARSPPVKSQTVLAKIYRKRKIQSAYKINISIQIHTYICTDIHTYVCNVLDVDSCVFLHMALPFYLAIHNLHSHTSWTDITTEVLNFHMSVYSSTSPVFVFFTATVSSSVSYASVLKIKLFVLLFVPPIVEQQ